MSKVVSVVSCLVLLSLSIGCGGVSTYSVDGQVEFEDGSPVMFGTIEFLHRESKLNAKGKISRDGSFTINTLNEGDGAVAGVHEVTIHQFVTVPLASAQNVTINHDHGKLVSEKYRKYETSDLTVTIEPKNDNQVKLIVEPKDDN